MEQKQEEMYNDTHPILDSIIISALNIQTGLEIDAAHSTMWGARMGLDRNTSTELSVRSSLREIPF